MYSGQGLKVTCPVCRLEIEDCLTDVPQNPRDVHRQRSPQCSLALECSQSDVGWPNANLDTQSFNVRTQGGVELTSFSVNAEATNNSQGTSEIHGILRAAVARASENRAFGSSLRSAAPIDRKNPDLNRLKAEHTRLETFNDWPTTANAKPSELAANGWFFTGEGDRVCCAFCRGILHHWTKDDSPASEHRRHFPACPFVAGRDVGNVPLEERTVTASRLRDVASAEEPTRADRDPPGNVHEDNSSRRSRGWNELEQPDSRESLRVGISKTPEGNQCSGNAANTAGRTSSFTQDGL